MDVEGRACALLRERGAPLLPVEQLYAELATELGEALGDAAHLRGRLRSRPDLFLLLERDAPLTGAEEWPAQARAAYEQALRSAGWEAGSLVGLAPGAGGDAGATPAQRVAAAIAQLAPAAQRDDSLRARVAAALPLAEATMRVLAQAFSASSAGGDASSAGEERNGGEARN